MQGALLMLLLTGLQCAVLQGQQVSVRQRLTGFINQEVILPCTVSISEPSVYVSQIMWIKNGSVAVYSPQHGTHVADSARFSLLEPSKSGATLRISPVYAIDQGEYTCEVTLFPAGTRKDTTTLDVKAVPQNSAEANPTAVANDAEQTVATCRSANGRPPARIKWNTNLPGNESTTMTNNSDGTYTMVSHYMMIPTWQVDGMPITCVITQESVETPIPLKLTVMYAPEVTIEGFDDNWHLKRNNVYLTCSARGNPPTMTYTWKTADGSPLPPTVRVKDNILYVNEVDNRVNKSFLCEATNALGSRAYQQDVVVREKPNTSAAGATGGIIGGIIAAIVGVAVVVTVIMICRQQRRNQTAKDEEEFEGPPAYKPPPPSIKMQIDKPAEEMPLKSGHLALDTTDDLEIEKNGKMPPNYQMTPESHHYPAYDDDDDYLEQENPIYNDFHLPENGTPREEQGFVMSPAVYV